MPKRSGPDGRLVKLTIGFPADVVLELGGDVGGTARQEIRRIVTEHVRSRRGAVDERDPETDGVKPESAVQ